MATEDEKVFIGRFAVSDYGSPKAANKTASRSKAERRATRTDKQHARGGRARTAQLHFRCTPAFKDGTDGLAKYMTEITAKKTAADTKDKKKKDTKKKVSVADVIEQAVRELAKAQGFEFPGK